MEAPWKQTSVHPGRNYEDCFNRKRRLPLNKGGPRAAILDKEASTTFNALLLDCRHDVTAASPPAAMPFPTTEAAPSKLSPNNSFLP